MKRPDQIGALVLRRGLVQSILRFVLAMTVLGWDGARATNFRLQDFVELERSSAEALLPKITTSYPKAKFFLSGFSAASGDWKLIRVEDPQACEGDLCPTVLVYSATDWNVLLIASREIYGSLNYEGGEHIQCELQTKGGRTITIRYSSGTKTISVAP